MRIDFFERYAQIFTLTREDCDELEDYLWDMRKTYLGVDDDESDKKELNRQIKEFDSKIDAYIDGLNWQKVVLINVGTPDSAKCVKLPEKEKKQNE